MSLGRIAQYELHERLGSGASGVVFRARDHRLHCDVALKVLTDPRYRGLLLQEARAEANLNHPNIARVFALEELPLEDPQLGDTLGLGRSATGSVSFMSMEFVDGPGLDELVRSGELSPAKSVEYALQIAEGLDAAHHRGVIHRDLKPANIRLTADNKLKILDFGLARVRADSMTTVVDRKQTDLESPPSSAVVGTLGYMAPEMVDGLGCDARSDLFSLGVILYQMLTMHRPFPGQTLTQIQDRIREGPPPPLARYMSNVPDGLEHIVHKLLHPNPDHRYQTARGLAADLQSIQSGAWSAPRIQPERPSQWRRIAAGVAGLILVGVVSVLLFDGLRRPEPSSRDLFVGVIEDIGDGSCMGLARGLAQSLLNDLAHVSQLNIIGVTPTAASDAETSRQQARRSRAGSILEGTIQCADGLFQLHLRLVELETGTVLWSNRFQGPLQELFSVQTDVASAVAEGLEVHLEQQDLTGLTGSATASLQASRWVLQSQRLLERFSDLHALDEAIQLLERATEREPGFALAHATLANAWQQRFELIHEREALAKAEAAALRALQHDPALLDARVAHAAVLTSTGHHDDARRELETVLRLNPDREDARFRLAVLEEKSGDPEQAVRQLLVALKTSPASWRLLDYLGALLNELGRHDEAREAFGRAIEYCPDGVVRPYSNYGAMELVLGNPQRMKEIYDRVPEEYFDAGMLSNLGVYYWQTGDLQGALENFRRASELDPENPIFAYNVGDLHLELGDQTAALSAYRSAADRMRPLLEREPDNQNLKIQYAVMLAKAGDCPRALELLGQIEGESAWNAQTAYFAALVHALCSEIDRALEAIELAVELGYPRAALRVETTFKDIADDPRFLRIVSDDAALPPLKTPEGEREEN